MLAFILRRLIQAVMVMVAVAFIAFMLFQYVGPDGHPNSPPMATSNSPT